jgi:hypothetical protein
MAALSKARMALPGLRPTRGLVAVLAVYLAALAVLTVLHGNEGPTRRLSDEQAVAAALRDPPSRFALTKSDYTRYRTTPIDDRLMRVSFFDGPRIVLDVAVAPDGTIRNRIPYTSNYVRVGSEIGQDPFILLLLTLAFVLAVARSPLEGRRNRDVAALISFSVPVMLVNARLFEASVVAAVVPLAYLGVRCLRVGFAGADDREPFRPLWEEVTAGWHPRGRMRTLVAATVAAALVMALLTVPGGLVSDVAFASMAGATDLTHGLLPYGNLPQNELVHGDTYPLLAYALYIPAALVTPVKGAFDNLDGSLYVALAMALAGAAAMFAAGRRHSETRSKAAGLRMALAWLTFPPVMIASSSGSNDIAAAAAVAAAAALLARPAWSALAVTVAGWIKLAPFLALPVMVARARGAELVRALGAAALLSAAVVAWMVALDGFAGIGNMVDALSFQAERGSLLSPWSLIGWDPAQLAFQAGVITLICVAALCVWRDRAMARDPRRVAGLAAGILLAVQLAAGYWSYTYLAWVFPLIAVALLSERRPSTAV